MDLHNEVNLLQHEIESILDSVAGDTAFRDSVRRPLMVPKRVLSPRGDVGWALLPLIICESICGHCEAAVPAAAAVEFFKTAADVFDDIEDGDSPQSLGEIHGHVINVGNALLALGQKSIVRLREKTIDADIVVAVLAELSSSFIQACTGQWRDLSLQAEGALSEELYLNTITLKSASQLECACRIGALVATSDEYLVGCFGSFGHNLGMAAQVTNDIQGILDASGSRNDIYQRKKTLPAIYALTHGDSHSRFVLESIYDQATQVTPDMQREAKSVLLEVGAVHYAVLVAEVFRQHALRDLKTAQAAGANVHRLKAMIDWQGDL